MGLYVRLNVRCERCSAELQKDVRVGQQGKIDTTGITDGWRIVSDFGVLLSYCPAHADDHKW